MEKVSIMLPTSQKTVEVNLDRKTMKTCRLKVYPTQEIVLSIPQTVPIEWAEEFLTDKSSWIESKLESFQRTSGYAATDEIRNGFSIKMLGEDMLFVLTECDKEQVYSEGKRICECLCTAYASEYNVPVRSARLAQTFGAGILENDNRVYAQFARSAIQKEDIVLHTDGTSEGNYCYTRDVVKALLILGYAGRAGEAYNIVNEKSHMQIREMAEMVTEQIAGGEIKVVYDIPESAKVYGYAPPVKMHLSADKMRELGWEAEVDMKEAYLRMMHDMTE